MKTVIESAKIYPMNLAFTYHDPEEKFADDFVYFLGLMSDMRAGGKIYVQASSAMRGTQVLSLLDSIARRSLEGLILGIAPEGPLGPGRDFECLATGIKRLSGPTLIIDADKGTMVGRYFPEDLDWFVRRTKDAFKDGDVGVVELERSQKAMETYPPSQRLTEPVINGAFGKYAGIEATDVTSGAFAISEEVAKEWRKGTLSFSPYLHRSNFMPEPPLLAQYLGKRVIGIPAKYLGAFETQIMSLDSELRPKKYTFSQTTEERPTFPREKERWLKRLDTTIDWLYALSDYCITQEKEASQKEVGDLKRMVWETLLAKDPQAAFLHALLEEGWIEKLSLQEHPGFGPEFLNHQIRGVERR
ncbi:MAG TPA: hypothetical protein VMW10_07805 [Alphaproteobacteria bacterium]|nr:hypothetical protein [Alphaproteobacteria bacterium]